MVYWFAHVLLLPQCYNTVFLYQKEFILKIYLQIKNFFLFFCSLFILVIEKKVMGNEKKQKFVEGEKVLCYHGPLLYEAKIHKLKVKDKVTKFLVHYAGWNTKWDEWVADSRVMKHNDDSLKKQKELKQQHTYVSYNLKLLSLFLYCYGHYIYYD